LALAPVAMMILLASTKLFSPFSDRTSILPGAKILALLLFLVKDKIVEGTILEKFSEIFFND
jgi:hypothetical protein